MELGSRAMQQTIITNNAVNISYALSMLLRYQMSGARAFASQNLNWDPWLSVSTLRLFRFSFYPKSSLWLLVVVVELCTRLLIIITLSPPLTSFNKNYFRQKRANTIIAIMTLWLLCSNLVQWLTFCVLLNYLASLINLIGAMNFEVGLNVGRHPCRSSSSQPCEDRERGDEKERKER